MDPAELDLVEVFDTIVHLETVLWNSVDAALTAALGLSLGRLHILRVIDRTPDCRVQDVVQQLAITVGGASKAVDRVETAGLCRRRSNPEDRRSSVLELTPAGERSMAEGVRALRRELDTRIGSVLPERTLRQLASSIDRLLVAHHQIEAGARSSGQGL